MKRFFFWLVMIVSIPVALMWVWPVLAFWDNGDNKWSSENTSRVKKIALNDDGVLLEVSSYAATIQAFMDEQHIHLQSNDEITPPKETFLVTGTTVTIRRSKAIDVKIGQETKHFQTFERTIENALADENILLDEDDFTLPERETTIHNGLAVSVVKVMAEEQVVDKAIPFEKIAKEDAELSWRKQKVEQKGEPGNKRLIYKVLTHNGKEVSRKLLHQEITKDPVTEIVVQGTYVKTGKAHTGLGTWYAHTGTLAAASPWLPMGSYAKVTNQENGKTVIVKINDRGPFGKNRILDLDKVAFAKIASLGAGVINLKVEEVTN